MPKKNMLIIAIIPYILNFVISKAPHELLYFLGAIYMFFVFIMGIIKPLYMFWIILGCFSLIPLFHIDPKYYYGHYSYQSLHFRIDFFGGLSIFELMMFTLVLTYILKIFLNKKNILSLPKKYPYFYLVLYFLVIGFIFGLINFFYLERNTRLDDIFVSSIPYVYFPVVYFLVVQSIKSKNNLLLTIKFLNISAVAMVLSGIVIYIKTHMGVIDVFTKYGLLNVIYGQVHLLIMSISMLFSYWVFNASLLRKNFFKRMIYILVFNLMGVIQILLSGARVAYVMLFGSFLIILILGIKNRIIPIWVVIKKIYFLIILGLLILILLNIFSLQVYQNLERAFLSIFEWSNQDLSNYTRVVEFFNIVENIKRDKMFIFFGAGLGTRWQEIISQPADSGAFLTERDKGEWKVVIHIPPLEILYRFGFIGLLIYLWIPLSSEKNYSILALSINKSEKVVIISLIANFIMFFIFFPFRVPSSAFFAALSLGLLDLFFKFYLKSSGGGKYKI